MMNLYKKNQPKNNQLTSEYVNIDTSKLKMTYNDNLYPKQWYLVSYFNIIMINKKDNIFRKMKVN
jgi:hypothetical protein